MSKESLKARGEEIHERKEIMAALVRSEDSITTVQELVDNRFDQRLTKYFRNVMILVLFYAVFATHFSTQFQT